MSNALGTATALTLLLVALPYLLSLLATTQVETEDGFVAWSVGYQVTLAVLLPVQALMAAVPRAMAVALPVAYVAALAVLPACAL